MINLLRRIQANMINDTSKEFIRRHIGPSDEDIEEIENCLENK